MTNSQLYTLKFAFMCLTAISSMTVISMSYKYYVSPYLKKKDFERNSAFANYVFDQEYKTKE